MYSFVKFVHIIAAMVYFGLPITFGRWLRSTRADPTGAVRAETLKKMRLFTFLHLNLCAAFLLGTGLWMVQEHAYSLQQTWVRLSLLLLMATLVNLNFNLGGLLTRPLPVSARKAERKRMAGRMALFSASHHTLITLVVALMVFKP